MRAQSELQSAAWGGGELPISHGDIEILTQKKCGPNKSEPHFLVEAAGVEPASKQGAPRLSTRLFCD